MKHLKFYLLLFIIFLTPSVFAQTINSDSYSQADTFNSSSRYDYSTNNSLGDQTNFSVGTIGTRYNGKSYYFQFNFHHSLTANKVYELKVSSTTNDFTNEISKDRIVPLCYSSFAYNFNTKECSNLAVISVIRGSGTQSKDFTIRFSPLQAMTYWGFKFAGGYYNLTGVNNFLINNFDLTEVNATDTDEIINNNNQNTQDIIDSQSQNTQDIINNANLNSLREYNLLRNQKSNTCSNFIQFDYSMGYHIKWNGDIIVATDEYYTTDYVPFNSTDLKYSITGSNSSNTDEYICFYDSSKNLLGGDCTYLKDRNSTAPSGSKYFRLSTKKYTTDVFYGYDGCSNRTDEINSYLKDNSNPNISDNEFLSVFNNIGFTDPLQHLLQLPVQFINALVSQSNTCQTINLGTLWGVALTLPCINLENIIGSNVWGIIDILMSIGLLVVIVKNLYQTFANLMTMGGEKEAREKFSMPTPMEFLSMILGGDK